MNAEEKEQSIENYYAWAVNRPFDTMDAISEDRHGRITVLSGLPYGYLSAAELEMTVKQDSYTALRHLYKAGRSCHFALRMCLGDYPGYTWPVMTTSISFLGTMYQTMTAFTLCEQWEALSLFAKDFRIDSNYDILSKSKKATILGAVLPAFLLGENNLALTRLGTSLSTVKRWDGYDGMMFVVSGILQKDIELINRGIAEEIKSFKRYNNPKLPVKLLSLPATAWVKLARHHGFDPDASSKFIHQGLLNADTQIEYEDIHEVYSIYNVTPLS